METRQKKTLLRIVVEALCNLHWHGREIGPVMAALIRAAIKGGADVLGFQPNTMAPLITAALVMNYLAQAKQRVPLRAKLLFLPFVMITERTTREELEMYSRAGIKDAKMYPYLRTTKSEHGVQKYGKMIPVVHWCGELGIKVHVHFEHPNTVHINRDAEYLCAPICEMFLDTGATVVWEHGSDGRLVLFWKKMAKTGRFYVTLTAHHLAWNEDEAFGDVRKKCKPPIKTEFDRLALIRLVSEDHDWVMLGADDAAHDANGKHVHSGKCACGDFTSPFLAQLCAHALQHLLRTKRGTRIFVRFTSRNGRKLHNLPPASRSLTLVQKPFTIPLSYKVGPWTVEPPGAGETIDFSLVE